MPRNKSLRRKKSAKPPVDQRVDGQKEEAEFWNESPQFDGQPSVARALGSPATSNENSISQILKIELSSAVTLEVKVSALPAKEVDLIAIQQSSQALIAELTRQNLAP